MRSRYLGKSLAAAYLSLKSWFGFFGISVAVVAVTNFIFSLFQLNISEIVGLVLDAYKAIIHGLIDWVTWIFGFQLSWYVKDMMFLYSLVGGSFLRSRASEGRLHLSKSGASIRAALWGFIFNKDILENSLYSGRLYLMYKNSPVWLKKTMDVVLWPRVAIQYFNRPCVYRNTYNDSIQSFAAGYKPGGIKEFLYDRRIILGFQMGAVTLGFFGILILNGFLILPNS